MARPSVGVREGNSQEERKLKITRLGAVGCLAIAIAGVSACGGGDDRGPNGSTTGSTRPSAPKAKGPAITVGALCSCSGPQKAVLGGSETVLKAWEADVN